MDTTKIPCRRCLFEGVDRDKVMNMIQEYLGALSDEERASDSLYHERLHVCGDCSRLENGLCVMCGCFVLYRAGRKDSRCPVDRW